MLRLTIVAIIATVTSYTLVHAQPIIVRSGEHPTFTRLVLQLPNGVSWTVENSVPEKRIVFENFASGFDTSRVFDVIPRRRLQDISSSNSALDLVMNCACEMNVFREAGNYLVIDLLDGPPLPVETDIATASPPSFSPGNFAFGELLWSTWDTAPDTDFSVPEGGTNVAEAPVEPSNNLVTTLNLELAESLGRAASRGILEINPDRIEQIVVETTPKPEPEVFDSSSVIVEAAVPLNNLRVSTSRDAPSGAIDPNVSLLGRNCPSADATDLPNWGQDRNFSESISKTRANLFNDLGRLDDAAAENLARTYLYFGFGAEAREALRLLASPSENSAYLIDISEIFENGYVRNPRVLHQFSDCDSDLAMWSMLAARQLDKGQLFNIGAALRGLARQPDHVRPYLATELSERLLQIGETEAASIALRNGGEAIADDNANGAMVAAKLTRATGDVTGSIALIEDLATSGGPTSPEALVELIHQSYSDEKPLAPDLTLLAEAYALETRDTQIHERMVGASILAQAMTNQFEKALTNLHEARLVVGEDDYSGLLMKVFSLVTKNADDISFLDYSFDHLQTDLALIQGDVKFEVSARAFSLGFPAYSLEVLTSDPSQQFSDRERLLAAEASFSLGLVDQAIEYLQGITGDQAYALRAKAEEMIGNQTIAHTLYRDTNDEQSALESSWLSDDWRELIPEEDPIFGELTELANTDAPATELTDSPLSQSQTLLEQTESAREAIERMLESISLSESSSS